MAETYDAIVIGAGHNGLTCACYLAKAGLRTLLLEQHHAVGGMTSTDEITLPGFHSDLHAFGYQLAHLSPAPAELELEQHGFRLLPTDPGYSHVFPDGGSLSMRATVDDTCASIARYSEADAATWRRLFEQYLGQKEALRRAFNSVPPSLGDEVTALQHIPGGWDEYRFNLQSVRSWADETFQSPEAKVFLGTFGIHVGAAPDDAGGAAFAWLIDMLVQDFGNTVVAGGMGNLARALASVFTAAGGEVRTHARVERIVVQEGRATAVRLTDGEEIGVGRVVASAVDPGQLAERFLGADALGDAVVAKMRRYEWGDSVMVIYLALDRPPRFRAGDPAGRGAYVHPTPPTFDYAARLYLESRGGLLPARPFVLVGNDGVADPGRVPPGMGLMKLVVQPVPWQIRGDASGRIAARHWDNAREPYADHVIELLAASYLPDLPGTILKRVVHSPLDLERMFPSTVHGTIVHGAMLPYQIGPLRPVPELGRYRSPVANVYLCASGSHPGGGVSLMPGRNAARVIAGDLGLDLGRVLAADQG